MRAFFALVWNLATALLLLAQNLARGLLLPRFPEYVLFDLSGDPPYRDRRGPREPWWVSRGPRVRSIEELRRRVRVIAREREVAGVVFRLRGLQCGLAKLAELRELAAELRAAGKRVVFYADEVSNREYLLACCGDAVWLAPGGHVALTGLQAEALTFAGALAQAGLTAEVVRRGAYKTAGELLANREPSPEQKETLNRLLDGLYEEFVGIVAGGRRLGHDEVRSRIDRGPYGAKAALEAGLVDGLCYSDELGEKLAGGAEKRARIRPYAALEAARVRPLTFPLFTEAPPAVALVSVEGLIGPGRSAPARPFRVAGAETLRRALDRARLDPGVRGVVLHVDSRGGSALASDLVHRAVRRLREKKPVVAYLEDVAASGGYLVACGAQRILASPTCVTGSIGVLSVKLEASELLKRLEVGREEIARGKNAGWLAWTRRWTESERAAMERNVQEFYDAFLDAVAEGRSLRREQVLESAEGRVFLAGEAISRGLVDALGPFEAAVDEAKRLAGIPPLSKVRLVPVTPPVPSFLSGSMLEWASSALDVLRDGLLAVWPWSLRY